MLACGGDIAGVGLRSLCWSGCWLRLAQAQTRTVAQRRKRARRRLRPHVYWPTAGWHTAAPQDHGIDPAALAMIEDEVAKAYPQIRSVLIVRHGYLLYEDYWQGLD